jgi:hypothetical protein
MHGRRSDGVGGRFSPGVTCRSMNRLVSSERLSSASPAMSSETSRDQPSAVLKATTRRASLYWPEKIADDGLPIGLGGVGLIVGDAELAVIVRAWRTTPWLHAGERLSPEVGDRQPGHLDRPTSGMHGPRRRRRADGDRRNLRAPNQASACREDLTTVLIALDNSGRA